MRDQPDDEANRPQIERYMEVPNATGTIIDSVPAYRKDATGNVVRINEGQRTIDQQIETLNRLLKKCEECSGKMLAKGVLLDRNSPSFNLDFRKDGNATTLQLNRDLDNTFPKAAIPPVVITEKAYPEYATPGTDAINKLQGLNAGLPANNPLTYRPITGGIILPVHTGGATLGHELGHTVGWFDPLHPMLIDGRPQPTHSGIRNNLMGYERDTEEAAVPDKQWCEKIRLMLAK